MFGCGATARTYNNCINRAGKRRDPIIECILGMTLGSNRSKTRFYSIELTDRGRRGEPGALLQFSQAGEIVGGDRGLFQAGRGWA